MVDPAAHHLRIALRYTHNIWARHHEGVVLEDVVEDAFEKKYYTELGVVDAE